ncbi:hypothetical protein PAPYR_10913 [Paratrimastix pyriformis]|uniref:Integrase catalytic domain-containing protein n=1 Tax=Paratrimastix pyriformis TaxID=342808 RepID=A0ABQ8U4X7_9EUKA|nr:hypothetical protein PAPYR_10913 [Paratrimastix pyriformis]
MWSRASEPASSVSVAPGAAMRTAARAWIMAAYAQLRLSELYTPGGGQASWGGTLRRGAQAGEAAQGSSERRGCCEELLHCHALALGAEALDHHFCKVETLRSNSFGFRVSTAHAHSHWEGIGSRRAWRAGISMSGQVPGATPGACGCGVAGAVTPGAPAVVAPGRGCSCGEGWGALLQGDSAVWAGTPSVTTWVGGTKPRPVRSIQEATRSKMTTIAGDACKIASRSLICGRFSRWVVLAPATAVDADTTARLFYERWVGTFGPPAFLVSDGGSAFISRTFQQLSDLLASQHHITSPHHPESHGTVERANRSVLATLRTLLHETVTRPRSWVDAIPAIHDLGILHLSDDPESLAARLAARSVGLIAQVAAAEKESFAKVRAAYEKKHRQHPEYSPGDYALCRNFQAGKLEMPWNGPSWSPP